MRQKNFTDIYNPFCRIKPQHLLIDETNIQISMLGGFFMEEKLGGRMHKLFLQNRGNTSITGVTDVVSFDECQVILDTD